MGLLTIGAFARLARLSPKALRLYDERGLLPPAAVDPETGYRLYDAAQLDRARLIVRLRGIGMPLAEIGTVCGLEPAAAAEAVDAYWQRVAADVAARERLAALLVDQLSGRGTAMTDPTPRLRLRHATRCDGGAVRESNQDTVFAGDRLLAVADGGGGPAGGAASAAAVDALTPLEAVDAPATELLGLLADAVGAADRTVRAAAAGEHQPISTLTAMLRSGGRLAIVHVGDTRIYRLRDGKLRQLTHDHTYVQSLVDQGRLTSDEAAARPDRALLVRALGAGAEPVELDLSVRSVAAGDRYLLCSDGLSAVVDKASLHTTLGGAPDPDEAVRGLVELAYAQGAPDNIACVVADVVAA